MEGAKGTAPGMGRLKESSDAPKTQSRAVPCGASRPSTEAPRLAPMTDLQKKYGSFPGAPNVAAIDAAPGVNTIGVRAVRCRQQAGPGAYPSTGREARRERLHKSPTGPCSRT